MPEHHDHDFVRRINLALLTGAANLDTTHLAAITGLPSGVVGTVLTNLEVDNRAEGKWRDGVRYYRLTPAGLRRAHQAFDLELVALSPKTTEIPTMTRAQITRIMSELFGFPLADPAARGQLYLVDVDGTVALRDETRPDVRHPFAWDRVGEDLPNRPVVSIVQALDAAGRRVIYLTGRSSVCRAETAAWLAANVGVPGEALLMRTVEDYRPDTVVKRELYDQFVVPVGPVTAVLEDRAKVVAMWRDLGLTVLQCAEGDF
ncbi:hypothetical protein [Actinomadura sp. 3N508]|uniref:phosphatase domain-containing protein n=1 Tax=Actinomadura sp. 3N508 TaxID=3375153 RepID=UPI0037B8AC32